MTTSPGAAEALSLSLADAAEHAARWTVRVAARRRIGATGVAWTTEGVVVTADHVIESEDDVTVGLPDGSAVPAQVVGRDPGTDLAVLRLDGASLPAADHAPEGSVRVGQLALGLGRPGSSIQASLGVVSALGGQWRTRRGRQIEGFVRSDVTFFPGFSGGPLIDVAGRLIGINTSRFGPAQGIAIPAAVAGRIIEVLLAKGRISRAYVGIGSQPVALPPALAARIAGQESGLLVVSVEPSSPADVAGLLVGDILVGMSGVAIADAADLQSQLGPERVGEAAVLQVLRGGAPLDLPATLGERP